MKHFVYLFLFLAASFSGFSQSIDDPFPQKKMRKDLKVFKNIRQEANSGLYKYRTKAQIDSIYQWADKQIDKSSTYRDFYNIICQLTDFEGSLHNFTVIPNTYKESLKAETKGYFPYLIKWIEGKWIINYENEEIPLGAEIISINAIKTGELIKNLHKYYTTDGVNTSGKRIGLEYHFAKYYRLNYGLTDTFTVEYRVYNSEKIRRTKIYSVGYTDYYKNVKARFSKPFDEVNYKDWKEDEIYSYKSIDNKTGILTVNDFGMGDENDPQHLKYVHFLDSIFSLIKKNGIKNLIVDVRYNGGGNDPNDIVTYSYLTQRSFQENKQAWVSFKKIPYLRYAYSKIPKIFRFLGVRSYNREFKQIFPKEIDGKFYQNETSNDHKKWLPNKNAFTGTIYLLISPRIASAGSLFAAMVTGNSNSVVIGEETMGGYYGHNGHSQLGYVLPKSHLGTFFSVVNLEQDVPKKENQLYNRGIIPDHKVSQTYGDYLNHSDTQMNFVLELIKKNTPNQNE